MLRTIEAEEIPAFRTAIEKTLEDNGGEKPNRTISTPARKLVDTVRIYNSHGIWVYTPNHLNIREDCYNFFIGLLESETPAVELNIATVPTNLRIAGRCLKNENGDYFLGHAGYLRGGRRNVPKTVFQSHMLMRVFRLESFRKGDNHNVDEAYSFRIDSKEFLSSLSTYAKACVEIRQKANSNTPPR